MKKTFIIALGLGLIASLHAQIAADDASNAVYVVGNEYIQVGTPPGDQAAATNGLNGGYGFNRWQRGGYGTFPNQGTTLITNLPGSFNMGSQQFGLRAGVEAFSGADARRRLLVPMTVGQVLSISMMAGGNGAGQANTQGEFGVEFRSSLLSNPGRDMVSVNASPGGSWTISDRSGSTSTGILVTGAQRIDVKLSMTGGDNYRLDITPFGGSTVTFTGLFVSVGQQLQTAQFYTFNTNGDFYANNLKLMPETLFVLPSSYTIIQGLNFGGNLASLFTSDNDKVFVLCDEFNSNGEIQFDSTLPAGTVSQLKFKFEGSATRTDLTQFVRMFNFSTNAYTNVNVQNATLADSVVEGTITSGVANYYSGTREVISRVLWIPQTDIDAADGWVQTCDQAIWTMN